LHQWFVRQQPDAHLFFPNDTSRLANKVICAEYSAALQLNTLGIDIETIEQPLPGSGCGKEYPLVKHFQQICFEISGIDRDTDVTKPTKRFSWIGFDYTDYT
jgi:hypothetical protein